MICLRNNRSALLHHPIIIIIMAAAAIPTTSTRVTPCHERNRTQYFWSMTPMMTLRASAAEACRIIIILNRRRAGGGGNRRRRGIRLITGRRNSTSKSLTEESWGGGIELREPLTKTRWTNTWRWILLHHHVVAYKQLVLLASSPWFRPTHLFFFSEYISYEFAAWFELLWAYIYRERERVANRLLHWFVYIKTRRTHAHRLFLRRFIFTVIINYDSALPSTITARCCHQYHSPHVGTIFMTTTLLDFLLARSRYFFESVWFTVKEAWNWKIISFLMFGKFKFKKIVHTSWKNETGNEILHQSSIPIFFLIGNHSKRRSIFPHMRKDTKWIFTEHEKWIFIFHPLRKDTKLNSNKYLSTN